ncbi:LOW QUALITY PROTEIN: hypothetical protein HID58_074183 [Brassica napus]|uniref:F-box domain-containing protein n=1 Tax=Brassica napus TaxID=3708 RepID=A0ABQ7YJ02_BRANA|nr:LOW QUALITY PROTEIN: hypothetical protein HID58_074183 [Brassica napus]
MPDEILNHILSFIPIDLAIRTSVLSRRWRHAWCELPCLHLRTTGKGIDQTLLSYRRLKIMSFKLRVTHKVTEPQFNSWVEFAMSRNVGGAVSHRPFFLTYGFPDSFYLSSSLRQLKLVDFDMLPECTMSWNFLRRLTLSSCSLYDESIANILSGSPNLETLQLFYCGGLLKRLDLSQMEIVAPHIHYLNLKNSNVAPCTLVDVSSLADAILCIGLNSIARLLQNSPGLKKLEVHATYVSYITDADLDAYLRISQGLDSDTCWRSKHEVFPTTSRMYSMSDCNDALKLLDSFLRLVLRNAKRLEKIVVRLGDSYFSDEQRERLLMVGTLSPNNNVSIEFK